MFPETLFFMMAVLSHFQADAVRSTYSAAAAQEEQRVELSTVEVEDPSFCKDLPPPCPPFRAKQCPITCSEYVKKGAHEEALKNDLSESIAWNSLGAMGGGAVGGKQYSKKDVFAGNISVFGEGKSGSGNCPTTYGQCFAHGIQGCIYMPKGEAYKLDENPELQGYAGKCFDTADLLADVAPSVVLLDSEPEGDAVRIKTQRSSAGDRWIAMADLCGQGQSWDTESCKKLCPADLHWKKCIPQIGCVYVYASNLVTALPQVHQEALKPTFGKCMAANGIIGASPTGSAWHSFESGKKGLIVKALDKNTGESMKQVLEFPPENKHPVEHNCEETRQQLLGNEMPFGSSWPPQAHRKESLLQACQCIYWRQVKEVGAISQVFSDYGFAHQSPDDYLLMDYGCWHNVLSKDLRMPVQFVYVATADMGNHDRSDHFSLDDTPGLLAWQPPKWSRSDKYGAPYDVGHLVMANHFDSYKQLIYATNLMTNVLPQLRDMNRYAWLSTEYLVECAREGIGKENVFVIGGCVWPDQPAHIKGFEKMKAVSYVIKIPDYCWKVISTPNRGHVAFYIPNTAAAKITKSSTLGQDGVEKGLTALSEFVVSLTELESKLSTRQTPQTFLLSGKARNDKNYKPSAKQMAQMGWSLKCDKK